jgi:hypothetical protein
MRRTSRGTTLTPTLSRSAGEGEASRERHRSAPSPALRERAGVRALTTYETIPV